MISRVFRSTQSLAESLKESFPSPNKEKTGNPPSSPSKSNSGRNSYVCLSGQSSPSKGPSSPTKVSPKLSEMAAATPVPFPSPSQSPLMSSSGIPRYTKNIDPCTPTSSNVDIRSNAYNAGGPSTPTVADIKAFAAQRNGLLPPEADMNDLRTLGSRPDRAAQGGGLKEWELKLTESPEVRRKATVAQLYFLDYYFDLLNYLHSRQLRHTAFTESTSSRELAPDSSEYRSELRSYLGRERVLLRKRRTKLKVDQFRIIAQVGQGGYGSVYLARKADTGEVCALKKMKKRTLAKMDEIKHVLVERDILTATKTPWLVRLMYAFQDPEHIYLAMEYVPGGDFRTLLNNSGVLKEEHARFYISEMFVAVNELHKLGYIHRDLKPENFLVDGTGHVKLTDFGLATGALNPMKIESMRHKLDQAKDDKLILRNTLERRTIYRSIRMTEPRYADSVVGSPDYMPPEVLRGKQYSYSVDYWSLGCILFEFLAAYPPFSGATPDETWANLKNWQRVLTRPVYTNPKDLIFNMSDEAWDVITRLITHDKTRISSLTELQMEPFFASLPFNNLRDTQAPFVPSLEGEDDVGYYDDFTNEGDLAKYGEVFEKQRHVDAVQEKNDGFNRGVWVGFTFGKNSSPATQAVAGKLKAEGEALATMF
ncbi:kinase-like protein [Phaffia rhodozyma]|uniref:non-specific serine/threonine protein kinase n=1 Tax=Phaffia rhodozyma TaxID=264483 RepID=A0A0F7ST16_PHARH|nr:kinase-like protein [Phaffia rhodozyma]